MSGPLSSAAALEMMTYGNIQRRVASGELVLRIHHPMSASPLVWTGSPATSGFSAPQTSFDGITPIEYSMAVRDLGYNWMENTETRNIVIDHIHDRRAKPPVPDPMTQDIEMLTASPFISVTADLDWALYWIAHQLGGTSVPAIHLAVIRKPAAVAHRGETLLGEICVKPFSESSSEALSGLPERQKHNFLSARGKARERSEWFFYGRIFGGSVVADLVFTPTTLPFPLPTKFWRPLRNHGNGRSGWLSRLRWNPLDDAWKVAQNGIGEERHNLNTGWAAVPTNPKQINMWPPGYQKAAPKDPNMHRPAPSSVPAHAPGRTAFAPLPPRPPRSALAHQIVGIPRNPNSHLRQSPPHFRGVSHPYHQFRPQRPSLHVPYQPRPPPGWQTAHHAPYLQQPNSQNHHLQPYRPAARPVIQAARPQIQTGANQHPIQPKRVYGAPPPRPQPRIIPQALKQVNAHLEPVPNVHHGHRARPSLTERFHLPQRPILANEADLMGPEDFERTSLARAEAMLINLRL